MPPPGSWSAITGHGCPIATSIHRSGAHSTESIAATASRVRVSRVRPPRGDRVEQLHQPPTITRVQSPPPLQARHRSRPAPKVATANTQNTTAASSCQAIPGSPFASGFTEHLRSLKQPGPHTPATHTAGRSRRPAPAARPRGPRLPVRSSSPSTPLLTLSGLAASARHAAAPPRGTTPPPAPRRAGASGSVARLDQVADPLLDLPVGPSLQCLRQADHRAPPLTQHAAPGRSNR